MIFKSLENSLFLLIAFVEFSFLFGIISFLFEIKSAFFLFEIKSTFLTFSLISVFFLEKLEGISIIFTGSEAQSLRIDLTLDIKINHTHYQKA